MWEVKENDRYGEDKSVMLGAVLTRAWDRDNMKLINPKLAWIIGVCTDHEYAFNEMHIPSMRQCVDVFSILANIMIRHQEDCQATSTTAPLSTPKTAADLRAGFSA
jgi:hypothetical protein